MAYCLNAMKLSPQLVVHERDPIKRGLLIALIIFVTMASGYLLYDYGHSRSDYDFTALQVQRGELQDEINRLLTQVENTRDDLVANQRSTEIEKLAYAEVNSSLGELQSEILELKEEVAFYRSIVAPRESSRGLRIQKFDIVALGQKNNFRYKLVLTQVIKNTRITRGNVVMQIEGVNGGKSKQINLTSLSAKAQKKLDFRFKYFQSFEGDLVLPKGFIPSRVHVKVSSNRVTLEKTFAWPTGLFKTSAL